jgi:hypothetical protein
MNEFVPRQGVSPLSLLGGGFISIGIIWRITGEAILSLIPIFIGFVIVAIDSAILT